MGKYYSYDGIVYTVPGLEEHPLSLFAGRAPEELTTEELSSDELLQVCAAIWCTR